MAEQPPRQIGKYTIRGELDNGAFAHAYLTVENQSDGDFNQPHPQISSESVDSHIEQSPILDPEEEEGVQNLSLPSKKDSDLFYKFFRLLKALSYNPQDVMVAASLRLTYKYTRVEGEKDNESQYRVLIYIRNNILNALNLGEAELATINMICSAFDKDTTIIIFSESSEYPNIDIYWLLKEEWPKRIKKGDFVPWKYVEYLTRRYDEIKQNQNSAKYEAVMKVLKKDVARILDGMWGKKE